MPAAPTVDDIRVWPGLILTAIGIVCIALTLNVAGYGHWDWGVMGALTSVLCLRFGIALLVAEHRRAKAGSGDRPADLDDY